MESVRQMVKIMHGEYFEKLYVKDGKILPNNVDVIEGRLHLSFHDISKIENLPKVIKGALNLSNNNISKIENLPKVVKGDLWLYSNPVFKQFEKSNFTDQKKWAYYIQRLNQWVNSA